MSGWIEKHLSNDAAEAMRQRGVPEAAVPVIMRIASLYRHLQVEAGSPSSKETRRDLKQIEAVVERLRQNLRQPPPGLVDAALLIGRAGLVADVLERLSDLDQVVGLASQRVASTPGRPAGRRTFLAVQIADILEDYGATADSKANGPLCQALGIIFAEIGEVGRGGRSEPNPVSIAKVALAKRAKNLA